MNAETKFVSSVMDARLKKAKRERDAYKKQRDELINDIEEVKRKAEAFDEMVKIYNQKNDLPSDEIYMEMGYCISDLERGSDE